MTVLLGRHEPQSPEWHALRAGGIGGSEIAAVLGLSKWESRFSLWHRKAGNVPPQMESAPMEAGRYLEDAIVHWWTDQHPELISAGAGTFCHSERPWQIANPDRVVWEHDTEPAAGVFDGIVECKFALYDDEWGAPGTDEIPPYYLTQCRWYLDVLEAPVCYVAVFIGSQGEFREYVIRQDEDDIALMRREGQAFMDSLANGVPPGIDGHTETYRAVRELHPDIDGSKVDLPLDLAKAFCDSRRALAAATEACQEATSRVADFMGSAKTAHWNGAKVADRRAKNGGTPYLQAAKALPTDFTITDQGDAA